MEGEQPGALGYAFTANNLILGCKTTNSHTAFLPVHTQMFVHFLLSVVTHLWLTGPGKCLKQGHTMEVLKENWLNAPC